MTSSRYLNVSEELRVSLRRRLVSNLGDAANSILRFVDSLAGPDALALAAVCQVIFGDGQDAVLDAAAARMEQYHDNKPIAKRSGRASVKPYCQRCDCRSLTEASDPRLAQEHLQLADDLLETIPAAGDHAFRSRLTRLGYEQRLSRFGKQITFATLDEVQFKNRFGDAKSCRLKLPLIGVRRLANGRSNCPALEMALPTLTMACRVPRHRRRHLPEMAKRLS